MMFGGFTVGHILVLLGVIVMLAIAAGLVVVVVVVLSRSSARSTPAPPAALRADVEARLEKLAQLHAQGQISDSEYAAERARILGEI